MNTELTALSIPECSKAGSFLAATASLSRAGREDSRQARCVPYGSVHPTGSSLLFFFGDPTKKNHLTKEENPSRWRKWGADTGELK